MLHCMPGTRRIASPCTLSAPQHALTHESLSPSQHFAKEPKNPLGRISLNSYFVSKMEDPAAFEFCVNAYPKVSSAS